MIKKLKRIDSGFIATVLVLCSYSPPTDTVAGPHHNNIKEDQKKYKSYFQSIVTLINHARPSVTCFSGSFARGCTSNARKWTPSGPNQRVSAIASSRRGGDQTAYSFCGDRRQYDSDKAE